MLKNKAFLGGISKNALRFFLVLAICAYGLYLRFLFLSNMSFTGGDSYYQASVLQGSLLSVIRSLPLGEHSSYLSGDYFLVYPFAKIFGMNKWGLVIPHIISTIVGFYLLYIICKEYFKTTIGFVITFLIVCLNATLIEQSVLIRPYAVIPTLALAVFYFYNKIVSGDMKLTLLKYAGIIVLFVLTVWFHTHGVLIILMLFAWILCRRFIVRERYIDVKKGIIFLSLVLGLAMPFWYYAMFIVKHASSLGTVGVFNTFGWIPNPKENIIGFLKAIFGNLLGDKKLYFLLLGGLFPFFIPYKDRIKQIAFVFTMVFIPVGVLFVAAVLGRYWFIQRHFIWTMPFFALYIGWSWESFYRYLKSRKARQEVC